MPDDPLLCGHHRLNDAHNLGASNFHFIDQNIHSQPAN
jgi:hypothetical protein